MSGNERILVSEESAFDRIDSPQFLDFNDKIPEPKDSYFEHIVEEKPKTPNFKKLQKLPTDLREDFTQNDNHEEGNGNTIKKETPANDFGDDLIEAVKTLQVDQPNELIINPKDIVTSTPFRVNGLESMAWTMSSKQSEINKNCTQIRPFSFEERNKQLLQRKAQRIQAILRAEKAARQFRANPIPKFLNRPKSTIEGSTALLERDLVAEKKHKTTETQQGLVQNRFKAKSPKVLRKPAFQPILPKKSTLPQPFNLRSELRGLSRAMFDQCVKEKKQLDECLKTLRNAMRKQREEQEIMEIRKQMEFRAQPIKKFKFFPSSPVSKRPLTEPVTPKVLKRQRR